MSKIVIADSYPSRWKAEDIIGLRWDTLDEGSYQTAYVAKIVITDSDGHWRAEDVLVPRWNTLRGGCESQDEYLQQISHPLDIHFACNEKIDPLQFLTSFKLKAKLPKSYTVTPSVSPPAPLLAASPMAIATPHFSMSTLDRGSLEDWINCCQSICQSLRQYINTNTADIIYRQDGA